MILFMYRVIKNIWKPV